MDYKEKILKALSLAENLDQIDYIEEKLKSTDEINRKTKQGRELTEELLALTNKKARELIDSGELPF
jgi:hypothetical protein